MPNQDKKTEINRHLQRAAAWLDHEGYNVAYLSLHGSQNYDLDTPESDYDFTAVVFPSLQDLIRGKEIATNREFEGGITEIMDIRKWVRTLGKCNPSYLESLATPYYVCRGDLIPAFKSYRSHVDDLIRDHCDDFVYSIYGHSKQTIARHSTAHPERGKLIVHAMRMRCILAAFYNDEHFELVPPEANRQRMIEIKQNNNATEEEIAELKDNLYYYKEIMTQFNPHTKSDDTMNFFWKLTDTLIETEIRRKIENDGKPA